MLLYMLNNKYFLHFITILMVVISLFGCTNNLTGGEGYKQYGEQIDDIKIVNNIKHALRNNYEIDNNLVHLAIDRGMVQISGFIPTYKMADSIVLTIRKVKGIKGIINNLIVIHSPDYTTRRAASELINPK